MEVEVFKTDVANTEHANGLKNLIEISFVNCRVNFDLDDCDRILRIVHDGILQRDQLLELLRSNGCKAEILPDVVEQLSLEDIN